MYIKFPCMSFVFSDQSFPILLKGFAFFPWLPNSKNKNDVKEKAKGEKEKEKLSNTHDHA